MAEFDEKLNQLLSDPNAMAQIMQMAQSLMGGGQSAPPTPPAGTAPPQGQSPFASFFGGSSPQGSQSVNSPPQGEASHSPPPGASPQPQSFNTPPSSGGFPGDLFGTLGSLDPKLIARLLPLVQELGSQQGSNARQLLFAMRPYLKPERQEKVERALQLARLLRVGRKLLAGWRE